MKYYAQYRLFLNQKHDKNEWQKLASSKVDYFDKLENFIDISGRSKCHSISFWWKTDALVTGGIKPQSGKSINEILALFVIYV